MAVPRDRDESQVLYSSANLRCSHFKATPQCELVETLEVPLEVPQDLRRNTPMRNRTCKTCFTRLRNQLSKKAKERAKRAQAHPPNMTSAVGQAYAVSQHKSSRRDAHRIMFPSRPWRQRATCRSGLHLRWEAFTAHAPRKKARMIFR